MEHNVVALFGFFATTIGVFADLAQIRKGLSASKVVLLVILSIGSACFFSIIQNSSKPPETPTEIFNNIMPGQGQQNPLPTQASFPTAAPFSTPIPIVSIPMGANHPQVQSMSYSGVEIALSPTIQRQGGEAASIKVCIYDVEHDVQRIVWKYKATNMQPPYPSLPPSEWGSQQDCYDIDFQCFTGGGYYVDIYGQVVDRQGHETLTPTFQLWCL